MNITIRQLEIFIAVSRAESYTQAAKAVHLTQPAVSMQIKKLEEMNERAVQGGGRQRDATTAAVRRS